MPTTRRLPFVPFRRALYSRLDGSLAESVFDWVPAGDQFPYVRIETPTAADEHLKDLTIYQLAATIHAFTKRKNSEAVEDLLDRILQSVSASELTLEDNWSSLYMGNDLVQMIPESSQEGAVQHGILRPRFKVWDTS